ncbi:hypothetical protein QJS10_CPB04g01307 [Acorus calamus]|uniref:Uncharacterized protein n=1 Tax=Acorus calamus TaxID=4465 RepID=A0AAV9F064_ACOCL|nr:hypothetical protein QJS10_CPB04g01307 [Acorus calamus]
MEDHCRGLYVAIVHLGHLNAKASEIILQSGGELVWTWCDVKRKKNLPTLPSPVTWYAQRKASSNPGSVPGANKQPNDVDAHNHISEVEHQVAQCQAEVEELHHAMDGMRRENKHLCNLLDNPQE